MHSLSFWIFLSCCQCTHSPASVWICTSGEPFPVRSPRQAPDISRWRFTQERTWEVSQGTWLHGGTNWWTWCTNGSLLSHTFWPPRDLRLEWLEKLKTDVTIFQNINYGRWDLMFRFTWIEIKVNDTDIWFQNKVIFFFVVVKFA